MGEKIRTSHLKIASLHFDNRTERAAGQHLLELFARVFLSVQKLGQLIVIFPLPSKFFSPLGSGTRSYVAENVP